MERHDPDQLRCQVYDYLDRRGLRSTDQRRLILETLLEAQGCQTATRLLRLVRERDERIGYATVVRAMRVFADSGIVEERKSADGFTCYELVDRGANSHQLACVRCGAVSEVDEPALDNLQSEIAQRHRFLVKRRTHILYGLCAACCSGEL